MPLLNPGKYLAQINKNKDKKFRPSFYLFIYLFKCKALFTLMIYDIDFMIKFIKL